MEIRLKLITSFGQILIILSASVFIINTSFVSSALKRNKSVTSVILILKFEIKMSRMQLNVTMVLWQHHSIQINTHIICVYNVQKVIFDAQVILLNCKKRGVN